MSGQLADSAALGLFFTDDIYLVDKVEGITVPIAVPETIAQVLPAIEKEKFVFKYLGKNQKNVLILVNDQQNDVSNDAGKELLRNIVKAIQLSANDFALVNYAGYSNADFKALSEFFSCQLVLSFGVTPSQLGLTDYPTNTIIKQDAIQLVFSSNLDLLAADQLGKKTLWGSLKQLSI